jgi:hypothetical protein
MCGACLSLTAMMVPTCPLRISPFPAPSIFFSHHVPILQLRIPKMIRIKLSATLLVALLSTTPLLASSVINSEDQHQLPLSSLSSSSLRDEHPVHPSILAALDRYPDDPVAALLHLKPELVELMEEPRLIQVFGEGSRDGEWMTEGDKLRLRREGKGFMDLTDSQFLGESFMAGKASESHLPFLNRGWWGEGGRGKWKGGWGKGAQRVERGEEGKKGGLGAKELSGYDLR